MIYPGGLNFQQAKIEIVAHISCLIEVNRVCAFLGFANYYWKYVKGFNPIAKPLNQLLKLDKK